MPWARKWDKCQQCGTTERKHHSGGLCKKCYAKEHKHSYPSRQPNARKLERERYPDKAKYERTRRWEAENREKALLQGRVRRAAERALGGDHPTCVVPGCTESAQLHHPSYHEPLRVIPLCPQHHKCVHIGRLSTEGLAELFLG